MFDKLNAYGLEPGCNVNDGSTVMKKTHQTQSFGSHVLREAGVVEQYGKQLAQWCSNQRRAKKNMDFIKNGVPAEDVRVGTERLSDTQIQMLEGIGFKWDVTVRRQNLLLQRPKKSKQSYVSNGQVRMLLRLFLVMPFV